MEKFLQIVNEGGDTSIGISTFQETYCQSLDLKLDYDENDGGDKILDTWKNLKVIGEHHIDIGVSNSTYKLLLLLFKDIHIETFPKYVHFTLDFMNLMVSCIQ